MWLESYQIYIVDIHQDGKACQMRTLTRNIKWIVSIGYDLSGHYIVCRPRTFGQITVQKK